MEHKLFTIIIPTYNRCEMLEESLQAIIPQIQRYKEYVGLYVSDNASTDRTADIVTKYLCGNEGSLSYFRQSENIGGQKNFRHAVKAVNADYVCLLGDDDIVFPNYVETIITLLMKSKENHEIGIVNYNVMSVDYNLQNASLRQSKVIDLKPVIYPTGKEFIYEQLRIPSLISSNVFHRKRFVEKIDTIPVGTYPGYDWMAVLYYSCLSYKCIFIGLPLLLQRYPVEQRWAVDAPWFTIYGFGHLFMDLDKDIPGLYNHWIEHLEKERLSTLEYLLHVVSMNKKLYVERFETMKPYMGVNGYEKRFKRYLEYPQMMAKFLDSPMRFLYEIAKKTLRKWV